MRRADNGGIRGMELTVKELTEATDGRLLFGNEALLVRGIGLNSRQIKAGDLFVPVIGARVDAHRFLAQAFTAGAVCAFTSAHQTKEDVLSGADSKLTEVLSKKDCALIAVDDTVEALQRLGAYYRSHYVKIPLIAVTGSVGKTTTRELIACALSASSKVFATKGNANSQVGVPVTMTEIGREYEIGVIELGMSEFGEMTRISKVAMPDCAVISNIGISHINQLKTQENILREKLHILDGMPDGAVLFLNGDDPLLCGLSEEKLHEMGYAKGKHVKVYFYGLGKNCAVRAGNISSLNGFPAFDAVFEQFPKTGTRRCHVQLSVMGMHMVQNALAALAVAGFYNVELEKAAAKLASFSDLAGRGARFTKDGITVIDDSYNAAPASMKAGISVLLDLPSKRHIAVLADMLELGENEAAYHREVGAFLGGHAEKLDRLYLYGPLSAQIAVGMGKEKPKEGIQQYSHLGELCAALKKELRPGDACLFKGSNGMELSIVIETLFPKSERVQ